MNLGIGKRIKDKRIELGLSQKELAHRMGYKSEAAISKVEHGEDNITTDRISKFAKALNCSPGYLMGWTDETQDIVNNVSSGLEKIGGLSFFDNIKKDSVFMENIKLLFSLPIEKRKEVYNFIQFKYYEIDGNRREKESNLGS